MASLALVLPLLPGKTDAWRQAMEELKRSRWEEFGAARRRQGISRERLWLQQTPQGDLEILYLETEDPARALQAIATSQEPFDVWFRDFVREHYGLDLSQPLPGPFPELVLDWSTDPAAAPTA